MVLQSLAEIVKQDVQEMNHLPETRACNREYRVVDGKGTQQFTVEQHQTQPADVVLETCVFEVRDAQVWVQPPAPLSPFHVSLGWDLTNNQCVYQIDGWHVALWEVSKRALEALFFE